jgi:hypothetical protein
LDYTPILAPSPERAGYCWTRTGSPTTSVRMGLKRLLRPFRARVSVWIPLTQAFSLGFVRSPLWGSRTVADGIPKSGIWSLEHVKKLV